jgi:hypothetical protein
MPASEIAKFRVLRPEWGMKLLIATSSHALAMIKIQLLTQVPKKQKQRKLLRNFQ